MSDKSDEHFVAKEKVAGRLSDYPVHRRQIAVVLHISILNRDHSLRNTIPNAISLIAGDDHA